MNSIKNGTAILLALVVSFLVMSCKGGGGGDTIKVGALFAVTGPASFLGSPEKKTAEMFVEELNANGGLLGKQITLMVKDTGGDPAKAVALAKQLINEEKVFAIIGPSTSGESLQVKDLCNDAKVILLSCAAAEKIVNPVARYVFNTPQKDSHAVARIFGVMKDMGISRVGVISANTGFGKAGKEQLETIAPKSGIQILISEVYDKDATDLTGVLTKVKAKNVQAIVNWSIEPIQAIVAKNIKQIGITVPLFQSHGFGNVKYAAAAGEAGEGIIFPGGRLLVAETLPDGHPQKELLMNYKRNYESRYKEDVSTFGGHAYDALLIFKTAVEKAGTLDSEKVAQAMEGITGLVGTAGVYNYSADNHNGLSPDAFEILTVKGGRFGLYTRK
ncbi:MAG: ABC transporter substrate-binding protein [Spirochaetes bacterium]|nr:ABC transporter substrate-binding protein [Spirochaetota bacterium]